MPAFPTQVFNSLVLIWLTSAMAAKTVDSDYTGTQQCMVARSENKDYTGLQQREGPECKLPMSGGSCSQDFKRYYFDEASGICKLFSYSGCGGNLNNFHTLADCNERCICSRSKEVGTCDANTPRYFYNTATRLCQLFMYGGCGGNLNNFPDQSACENVCKPQSEIRKRCLRRPEFGSCTNSTIRYYYDIKCECCRTFSYSGCEGNKNNFETEEQCLMKCESVKPSTATPATSTIATTAAPAGGSGGPRAIIIQTNQGPPNNIFQNLINMLGG